MDSHDLWIIRSILQAGYRPRIITTEFNSNYHITDALTLLDPTVNCSGSLPNNFTFEFQQCAWGASAGALRIVAESHGYTMLNVPVVFVSNTCMLKSDKAKQLLAVLEATASSSFECFSFDF
ncbi:unnamed protein product [Rotaria sp. Silwood2]|nr:unnamed protein product [Rotaria sp. Silwood2]